MRIGVTTSCLLVLAFAAPLAAEPANRGQDLDLSKIGAALEKVVEKVEPSVVDVVIQEQILEENDGGTAGLVRKGLARCSGIIASRGGEVMTLLRDGLPEPENGGEIVIEVTLHSGEAFRATRIATDSVTGVTLLQLEDLPKKLKLKPARLNIRGGVKKGSLVVAVGSASGMNHTFQMGMVSKIDRSVRSHGFYFPRAIQTDIPAEAGAVGGLLANPAGETVGMLAFSYGPRQAARPRKKDGEVAQDDGDIDEPQVVAPGSVMAIPADLLHRICSELKKNGKVTRGAFEASFEFYSRFDLQRMGISVSQAGLRARWVGPDGTAASGGLKLGDVVVQVEDRAIKKAADLDWLAEQVEYHRRVGSRMIVRVYRCSKEYKGLKTLEIEIGERRPSMRNIIEDYRY